MTDAVIISSAGPVNVYSGYSAVDSMYINRINSGEIWYDAVIRSNGNLCVNDGGVGVFTMIEHGVFAIYSGGLAIETRISGGIGGNGILSVLSSGLASNTTILSNGKFHVNSNGGLAKKTIISSGGIMYVSSGGTAIDVTVSSGGTMVIWEGAVTSNITSMTDAVIINS